MKYAKEIIELLSAYPDRKFAMKEILNTLGTSSGSKGKARVRVAAWRVLVALEEHSLIESTRHIVLRGETAFYWWRTNDS